MTSIADRYLPAFQFSEKHRIREVASTPELIRSAIKNFDDHRDPVLNALVQLREMPLRILARVEADPARRERARFGMKDFHLLEETPDEIVFGLMGKFWQPAYGLAPIADTPSFESYREPGSARLVMSYAWSEDGDGSFTIGTETRVCCHDDRARRRFVPYWLAIRPASGWIRRRILRQLKADAEQACQAAGSRDARDAKASRR